MLITYAIDDIIDNMETFTPHFIELMGGLEAIGKAIDTATLESLINDEAFSDNLIDVIMDNGFTHSEAKQNANLVASYVERGVFTTTATRSLI